jgi:hypothetical protein
MEIEIQEEGGQNLLSKTQKQKVRRLVQGVWTDDAGFYDHHDSILQQVHYDPMHEAYNHIEHNLVHDRHLVLLFRRVPIETPGERRAQLRKKLREAIQRKQRPVAHPDPIEQTYARLCQQLPEEQRRVIPRPSQVRSNLDMYKQMMTMIPNQNPLHQYLSLFMDP